MDELKPCPFCGGEAQMISRMDEDIWSHNTVEWCYVECKGCCVRTDPWPKHDRNPIEAWNRRAEAVPECSKCANRGKLDGLSQEFYCDSCKYSKTWLDDNFAAEPEVKHANKTF